MPKRFFFYYIKITARIISSNYISLLGISGFLCYYSISEYLLILQPNRIAISRFNAKSTCMKLYMIYNILLYINDMKIPKYYIKFVI
jgi:hypothetical protein